MFGAWIKLSIDTTMLAAEAQTVIGLRLMRLWAGGTAAQTETNLMVSEKVRAVLEAGATIAGGGSAHGVVAGYRKHVRANARRLRSR
jgi:heptaprenylglyceryl phosphate synthase